MASRPKPTAAQIERLQRRIAQLSAANDALALEIEERSRLEDELRASELGARLAVDGIPALVVVLSSAGIEHANRRALDFTGRTLAELRASVTTDLIHPHDLRHTIETFTQSIASSAPFEVELRVRRRDGVYPWFQAQALPVKDRNGHVEQWYVLVTDIDQRKRVEDELRARELSVRLLLESMESIPALAIVSNERGEIVFANRQVLDYYGRTLEEVKRWPTSNQIVHPDDVEHANQVVAEALKQGVACHDEYRLRRHDGVWRWFEGRYSPVRDEAGRIINWFVLMIDIDERRHTEESLRQSEAFLAEGQRLSSTGGFRWQAASGEMIWSEQLHRIFETDPAAPVSMEALRSLIHATDAARAGEIIDAAQAAGADFESEHRIVTPDGAVKHVRLVAHATHGEHGLEYVGAVQDVTRQRAAEEAVGKVRSELTHAARVMSLGALSASITHEVSQPLAGIATNASTCLRFLGAEPPDLDGARATAERTIRDADRAAAVIRRVRGLFSGTPPSREHVDLNDAAREVLALSSGELRRRAVTLRTEFAADLPVVSGDRVQLQQVILNLVLNAADAMSEVEGRPRELQVSTFREARGRVRVSVRDDGVGIDPDNVEHLFDAFYTTKGSGMGVGLSVSRSIIEAHQGRLWAELDGGPGATFTFSLPGRIDNERPAKAPAARTPRRQLSH